MNSIHTCWLLLLLLTPLSASAGMVAFFDKVDGICPSGWQALDKAKGRLILGTTDSGRVGAVSGKPISNKTPPLHKHRMTIDFAPVAKSVVALEDFPFLKQNTGVASATKTWSIEQDDLMTASDGNVPYIQMLVCEESGAKSAAENMRQEMVAFFNDPACPSNWEPYEKLNKRFVVPAPDNTETGQYNQTFGSPLGGHSHGVGMKEGAAGANQVGIRLNEIGMEASEKGFLIPARDYWAKNQSPVKQISTKASAADAVPYLELLACRKTKGRGNIERLSGDLMAFMTALACPDGWREKSSTHGRYLVGLPADQHAKSGTAFGGAPLASGEVRTHHHDVRYSFNWESNPFIGFTGNTNLGFAASGTYDLIGTTQQAEMNMPYVQLRHCIAPQPKNNESSGIRQ